MKRKRNRNPEQETTSHTKHKRDPAAENIRRRVLSCTGLFDGNRDGSEALHLLDRLDDLIDLLLAIGLVCALKRFRYTAFHVGPQHLALARRRMASDASS